MPASQTLSGSGNPNGVAIANPGDFYQDKTGAVWVCTVAPSTWKQIATANEIAVIFDDSVPGTDVNIRSDRAANQSPIDNTKAGITNLGSQTGTIPGATGVIANYATNLGGDDNSAMNDYTTVGGVGCTANADKATAIGDGATASGTGSAAFNSAFANGDHAFACNGATASGAYAFAQGFNSSAIGNRSFAGGSVSQANGLNSAVIACDGSVADGDQALAQGSGCSAAGLNSMAIGENSSTTVNARYGFAHGGSCTVTAEGGRAGGDGCFVSAKWAVAEGSRAAASFETQYAYGGGDGGVTGGAGGAANWLVMRGITPGLAANESVNLIYSPSNTEGISLISDGAYTFEVSAAVADKANSKARSILIKFNIRVVGGVPTLTGSGATDSFGDAGAPGSWTLTPSDAGNTKVRLTFATGAGITNHVQVAAWVRWTYAPVGAL